MSPLSVGASTKRKQNTTPKIWLIASGSLDKTIKLWSINGKLFKTLAGHTEPVYSVSLAPDGKTIASR